MRSLSWISEPADADMEGHLRLPREFGVTAKKMPVSRRHRVRISDATLQLSSWPEIGLDPVSLRTQQVRIARQDPGARGFSAVERQCVAGSAHRLSARRRDGQA